MFYDSVKVCKVGLHRYTSSFTPTEEDAQRKILILLEKVFGSSV